MRMIDIFRWTFFHGLSLFLFTKMISAECIEARATLQLVRGCPQTREAWAEAAARKNCGGIHNYCTAFTYVYHCVMNTWQNETVEVCAPTELIFGRTCAEYNYRGGTIQRNPRVECSTCPIVYTSNETFKYPECYRYVTPVVPLTESEVTTNVWLSSFDETTIQRDRSTASLVRKGEIQDQQHIDKTSIILGSVVGCVAIIVIGVILFKRIKIGLRPNDPVTNCKTTKTFYQSVPV